MRTLIALTAVAALLPAAAFAAITANHPWIRAPAPGAFTAAGYVALTNTGPDADHLLGASTPAAKNVTVHQTVVQKGIVRMSAVASLPFAPGQTITFRPGSYHLMLMGLNGPLTVGQSAPVTLHFAKAGDVKLTFKVEQPPIGSGPVGSTGDMHMGGMSH